MKTFFFIFGLLFAMNFTQISKSADQGKRYYVDIKAEVYETVTVENGKTTTQKETGTLTIKFDGNKVYIDKDSFETNSAHYQDYFDGRGEIYEILTVPNNQGGYMSVQIPSNGKKGLIAIISSKNKYYIYFNVIKK